MNNRRQRVRTLVLLTATVLAVALVGGCKKKDDIAGTWKDPKGTAIEVKDDKTFTVGTGAQSGTGHWVLADKKITLTVEMAGGKPVADQLKTAEDQINKSPLPPDQKKKYLAQLKSAAVLNFTISEDAKTMTITTPDGKTDTFTKEAAK